MNDVDKKDFLLLCARVEATVRAWYVREFQELMVGAHSPTHQRVEYRRRLSACESHLGAATVRSLRPCRGAGEAGGSELVSQTNGGSGGALRDRRETRDGEEQLQAAQRRGVRGVGAREVPRGLPHRSRPRQGPPTAGSAGSERGGRC